MYIAMPRDAAKVESCGSGRCQELEVVPGECVYANMMEGLPRGVFVPWDMLTDRQQASFTKTHQELRAAADKLKALFLGVGDVVAE